MEFGGKTLVFRDFHKLLRLLRKSTSLEREGATPSSTLSASSSTTEMAGEATRGKTGEAAAERTKRARVLLPLSEELLPFSRPAGLVTASMAASQVVEAVPPPNSPTRASASPT